MMGLEEMKCIVYGHQWKYVELNDVIPQFADIECVRCSATDTRWVLPNDIEGYDIEKVLEEYKSRTVEQ